MNPSYEYQAPIITLEALEAFKKATQTDHSVFPLTYATLYRQGEFKIVQELGIDLKNLLHSEQSYDFLQPLEAGDRPMILTRIKENKSKRGIQFLTLESEVICEGKKKLTCESTMVIRLPEKKGGEG